MRVVVILSLALVVLVSTSFAVSSMDTAYIHEDIGNIAILVFK